MEIKDTIQKFIVEEIMMADPGTQLDPTESLVEKGILDSLSLLRLIGFIEEQFSITVDDGEVLVENFESLNETTRFVEQKLAQEA